MIAGTRTQKDCTDAVKCGLRGCTFEDRNDHGLRRCVEVSQEELERLQKDNDIVICNHAGDCGATSEDCQHQIPHKAEMSYANHKLCNKKEERCYILKGRCQCVPAYLRVSDTKPEKFIKLMIEVTTLDNKVEKTLDVVRETLRTVVKKNKIDVRGMLVKKG